MKDPSKNKKSVMNAIGSLNTKSVIANKKIPNEFNILKYIIFSCGINNIMLKNIFAIAGKKSIMVNSLKNIGIIAGKQNKKAKNFVYFPLKNNIFLINDTKFTVEPTVFPAIKLYIMENKRFPCNNLTELFLLFVYPDNINKKDAIDVNNNNIASFELLLVIIKIKFSNLLKNI